MIDSHCHLTYAPLFSQLDGVLFRAAAAGVERMITIGTSIADARSAIELCKGHANIRCAIGVHPHHAAEAETSAIEDLEALAAREQVLALGEMGLDYHYDFSPRPKQQEIFARQLDLAARLGKPIVIHCREALDDCMAILRDHAASPAVFHCFTGTASEARRVLDAGHMFGFTGVITFKNSDELRTAAKLIPIERMLLETDAPYLSPAPLRKQKVNEPALIVHTAATLAGIKGVSSEELDRVTTENAARFFRWPL